MKKKGQMIVLFAVFLMLTVSQFNIFQAQRLVGTNSLDFRFALKGDMPIEINGNGGFAGYPGYGNKTHPYLIENKVINASGLGKNGIFIQNTNAYFIIRNCTITNALDTFAGIRFDNVNNSAILNNTLLSNDCGIFFNQLCTNNLITNNTVNLNHDVGIFIYQSDSNRISFNVVDSTVQMGIFLYTSDHCLILNNTIRNNGEEGIYISSSVQNTTIVNNTIENNNYDGIDVVSSVTTKILYNEIRNNNEAGINLQGWYNVLAFNVISDNKDEGIFVSGSMNDFRNNSIDYSEYGMFIDSGSESNNATYNNLEGNTYGFYLQGDYNRITWNYLFNNTISITDFGENNTIQNNTITYPNKPPTLTGGTVTPSFGEISTIFTYTVTYTDWENTAPTEIQVVIDGIPFNMIKQNPSDIDYTNGCIYNYSTTHAPGTHVYSFNTHDGINSTRVPTVGNYSGPNVGHPPILSDGFVTPSSGIDSTIFTYFVNYTDLDNDAPSYIRVRLSGAQRTMIKHNSSDADYTDGCIYNYSTTLTPGTWTYWFECSDGRFTVRSPTVGSISGPYVDFYPAFSYADVTPSKGNENTNFTFTILYGDWENQPPIYIQVVINGTPHDMVKDPTDNDFTNNCLYNYTTTLEVGTCAYYFIASDGNYIARAPSSGNYSDLIVTNPPILTQGGVSPSSGTNSTIFTFSVNYTDNENDHPIYVLLWVNGTFYSMQKQNSGDTDYTDGCIYVFSTNLSAGNHSFCFLTGDGTNYVGSPETGYYIGPNVSDGGNNGGLPPGNDDLLVILIVIIAIGAVSAITGFYYLKIKKKKPLSKFNKFAKQKEESAVSTKFDSLKKKIEEIDKR